MAYTHKTKIIKTSNCVAPASRPTQSPPEISLHLQLKWGLALLGEEKAKEYLAWLRKWLAEGRQ